MVSAMRVGSNRWTHALELKLWPLAKAGLRTLIGVSILSLFLSVSLSFTPTTALKTYKSAV